ncbi:MAG: DoxX family protein [Ferruginibacter sp.]
MTKRNKIIYWIATAWLALGMLSTGIVQLLNAKKEVDLITRLGYPVYLLKMLGIWKILGVAALFIPKLPLLQEWAYAGFFFAMSGAIISHIVAGSAADIFPALLLLVLTIVSRYFKPADRKMISVNSKT